MAKSVNLTLYDHAAIARFQSNRSHQFLQTPDVIREASFHRGRHPERLVHAREVIGSRLERREIVGPLG
jgi:hypothetical protein